MVRFSSAVIAAASLLFTCMAAQAQVTGEQEESEPAPSSQSRQVERLEGVPDDFSLQPDPDTARRARTEPMVQPLPQPTATTRPRTAEPQVTVPQATPTPRITAIPQPAQEQDQPRQRSATRQQAQERTPQATSTSEAETAPVEADTVAAPVEQPEAVEQAQPQLPSSGPVIESAPAPAQESETSSYGRIGWVVGALVLAAILGALGLWWLRRRPESAFTVEKIEPYRPPQPAPGAEKAKVETGAAKAPEPTPAPAAPQQLRPTQPSGLVQAGRPAASTNTGGFVTSSISTRPRQQPQQAAEPAPAPAPQRRYTSPDGRIVTSLARSRGERD